MISGGGGCKMPCESCGIQFSVFRRKRPCSECERLYCAACLRRGGGMCVPCRALSTRPLARHAIAHLKARDLQCFLQRQNVSTRGCVEKEELVSLCVSHVNSAAYRRRGPRSAPGPFTTLKGITTNINDLLNSAFDLRPNAAPPQQPTQPPQRPAHGNCYNAGHAHSTETRTQAPPPPAPAPAVHRERFTVTPGGERDVRVGAAGAGAEPEPRELAAAAEDEAALVDTADCFEVEDVDDAGWEFVTRPADPLPGDSDVLLAANEAAGGGGGGSGGGGTLRAGGTPQRAASELNLQPAARAADSTSLQDEPQMERPDEGAAPELRAVQDEEELGRLSVKQLKELLARNRVEYRGCLERADLLQRARMLYQEHARLKHAVESLPLEECCKICMAAPLECVLLECGHIAACTACSKQLAECPICRQYVVRAVRFFRS